MGKRIIQQARGHGSKTYRVRNAAFKFHVGYIHNLEGNYDVVKLENSSGHTCPLAKFNGKNGAFYNFAVDGLYEGQKITFGGQNPGDISRLGDLPTTTKVFNIELRPNDGGKIIKTSGNSGVILNKNEKTVTVLLPSKQEKEFDVNCRATIGIIAGQGRLDKPILKAGKNHFIKKTKSKLWPRTSAVKMNAIDHPFGSGRGKRPKSKIAKKNAPAGRRVGLLRPRRTGRRKK